MSAYQYPISTECNIYQLLYISTCISVKSVSGTIKWWFCFLTQIVQLTNDIMFTIIAFTSKLLAMNHFQISWGVHFKPYRSTVTSTDMFHLFLQRHLRVADSVLMGVFKLSIYSTPSIVLFRICST